MGWLFTTVESAIWHRSTVELMALTASFGLGLVYSMATVYRLPAVPVWNNRRTNAVFITSALLLGQSVMAVLLVYESILANIQVPPVQRITIGIIISILLFLQLLFMRKPSSRYRLHETRIGLILVGIIVTAMNLLSGSTNLWISLLIFLVVLLEEGLGRWAFYQARAPWFSA